MFPVTILYKAPKNALEYEPTYTPLNSIHIKELVIVYIHMNSYYKRNSFIRIVSFQNKYKISSELLFAVPTAK